MVAQQRQGVAAPLVDLEVALEVDLPQRVGLRVLEALPVLGGQAGRRGDQAVAMQDGRDGARWRHLPETKVCQTPGNLAPTRLGYWRPDTDQLLGTAPLCIGPQVGGNEAGIEPQGDELARPVVGTRAGLHDDPAAGCTG
jgi:hypothetical protein